MQKGHVSPNQMQERLLLSSNLHRPSSPTTPSSVFSLSSRSSDGGSLASFTYGWGCMGATHRNQLSFGQPMRGLRSSVGKVGVIVPPERAGGLTPVHRQTNRETATNDREGRFRRTEHTDRHTKTDKHTHTQHRHTSWCDLESQP